MQIRKLVEVKAIRDVIEETICDLCRCIIVAPKGLCRADDVTVSYRVGDTFPEGGSGTVTEFDICSKCFESKLIPWLEEQGASPRKYDWGY